MKRIVNKNKSNKIPVILEGKIQWAKVHKPESSFGTMKYTADLLIDDTNRGKILDVLEKAIAKNDMVDPSMPLKLHKNKQGQEILRLTRHAEHGPITVLDSNGNPLTDAIGNGSDVAVIAFVGVATSLEKRSLVPSVKFTTVKVLNLVKYGGSLEEQLSKITAPKNEDPLMDSDHGF